MRAIQKVMKHGNSWVVTLPDVMRRMMGIRPGDFVQLEFGENRVATLTKSKLLAEDAERSPGVIYDEPGSMPR